MKIEIEEHGAAQAARTIAELGARATDIRPVASGFKRIVGESNAQRFQTQGGGYWPPLSSETTRQKHGSARLLVDTGRLLRSLSQPKTHVELGGELVASVDVEYAHFHQYGTSKMPRRKLTELKPSEQRRVAELVEGYVAKGRT